MAITVGGKTYSSPSAYTRERLGGVNKPAKKTPSGDTTSRVIYEPILTPQGGTIGEKAVTKIKTEGKDITVTDYKTGETTSYKSSQPIKASEVSIQDKGIKSYEQQKIDAIKGTATGSRVIYEEGMYGSTAKTKIVTSGKDILVEDIPTGKVERYTSNQKVKPSQVSIKDKNIKSYPEKTKEEFDYRYPKSMYNKQSVQPGYETDEGGNRISIGYAQTKINNIEPFNPKGSGEFDYMYGSGLYNKQSIKRGEELDEGRNRISTGYAQTETTSIEKFKPESIKKQQYREKYEQKYKVQGELGKKLISKTDTLLKKVSYKIPSELPKMLYSKADEYGLKQANFEYKYREEFKRTQNINRLPIYTAGQPSTIYQAQKFSYDFAGGFVEGVREKPLKAAGNVALGFALPIGIRYIGKPLVASTTSLPILKSLFTPTTKAVISKGVGIGLPLVYSGSVTYKAIKSERPGAVFGEELSTTIIPLGIGAYASSKIGPELVARYETKGKPFVSVNRLVRSEVLVGEYNFPTAPAKVQYNMFVNQKKYKFKFESPDTKAVYHATPEQFPKVTMVVGGSSEVPVLYTSTEASIHFLQLGGEYELIGNNIFTTFGKPTLVRQKVLGFYRTPKPKTTLSKSELSDLAISKGYTKKIKYEKQTEFLLTKAKKGYAYVSPTGKTEIEAGIPVDTVSISEGIVAYTKVPTKYQAQKYEFFDRRGYQEAVKRVSKFSITKPNTYIDALLGKKPGTFKSFNIKSGKTIPIEMRSVSDIETGIEIGSEIAISTSSISGSGSSGNIKKYPLLSSESLGISSKVTSVVSNTKPISYSDYKQISSTSSRGSSSILSLSSTSQISSSSLSKLSSSSVSRLSSSSSSVSRLSSSSSSVSSKASSVSSSLSSSASSSASSLSSLTSSSISSLSSSASSSLSSSRSSSSTSSSSSSSSSIISSSYIKSPPPSYSRLRRKGTGRIKGYNVFLKRFGKFVKVGSRLPINKALRTGELEARRTLGATFKLEQVGTTSQQDILGKPQLTQFREFKIQKGRRVNTPLTFIQERKFRLGTIGEKKEIKQSKKKKLVGML